MIQARGTICTRVVLSHPPLTPWWREKGVAMSTIKDILYPSYRILTHRDRDYRANQHWLLLLVVTHRRTTALLCQQQNTFEITGTRLLIYIDVLE